MDIIIAYDIFALYQALLTKSVLTQRLNSTKGDTRTEWILILNFKYTVSALMRLAVIQMKSNVGINLL